MQKNLGGRPTKGDRRMTAEIKARVTPEDRDDLDAYAEAENITRADAIRRAVNSLIKEWKSNLPSSAEETTGSETLQKDTREN